MNYTDDARSVRVDFFKENGKWYTTEAVRWHPDMYCGSPIHEAFKKTLEQHLKYGDGLRLEGMWAVCLEPYHEHAYPLMMKVGDW